MVALERGWRDGGDVVGGILVLAFPEISRLARLCCFCLGDYLQILYVKNMARKVLTTVLKRVPPLNCHVEILNGLSVPLSWNSWSRTSRTRGAHPLTTCSAPFRALLFSSRITLNV